MTAAPVLRVQFVRELASSTGCAAIAWTLGPPPGDGTPVVDVDAQLRGSPKLPGILWHESLHLRIARRFGFGLRADALHALLDSVSHVFHAELLWWVARGRPVPPWVEVRG